jgi:glycosyltransferase involved in cell wall biosynthesis
MTPSSPRTSDAPVLSVVTPSFEAAAYIAETLRSVAALSTPHEHIVIDGGSTDATVDILRRGDRDGLDWVSEPDRGQTHAVNKGLARASGEVCGWLNGDDAYIPEAVDRALARMERDDGVDVVFGGIHFTDESGRTRRVYQPGAYSWTRYLFIGDYIPTPTFLFRRRLLAETGLLDERWVDAADYDFYLRLLHGRRVLRWPEPLVRFRYHPGSKTARDAMRAQREALAIRLQWARGARDRALMVGFDAAKRAILPRISGWPEPYGRVRSRGAER